MKASKCKNGTITLTGITIDMYNAMSAILNCANDRCFDEPDEDGGYYSNDDFVVLLDRQEREALTKMCKTI